MKIAICDDEPRFLNTATALLEHWGSTRGMTLEIYRFSNGDDLISALRSTCMDLLFLDVVMPLFNGIDTARELRSNNQNIPIIFLTSSKEFAVDSYEVKALNYLIKPISEEKLYAVLDEFLQSFNQPKEFFTAQTASGFCKIAVPDVAYLEARNKQVLVVRTNGTTIEIRESFSKCEEVGSIEKSFFKCHRSYIVNISHVEQFTKTQITMDNHAQLPISRNNYAPFKEAYFHYMFP